MAYSMYLILERFQYFLEDHDARGEAMYERYTSILQKK
jgi:hypothetical protein